MNSRPSKVMPLIKDQVIAREFHPQDRRLPTWCPGAHRHRQQIKPRFVYPEDGRFLLVGFFFIAVLRSCDHLLPRLFVALTRVLAGFLSAPARLTHQPPDVISMVTHAKGLRDHLGHSSGRPHVAPKSIALCSFG